MKRILWRDNFRRITEDNRRRFVSVEWEDGENHQSVKGEASQIVAKHLGDGFKVGAFVDVWHARRFDGHPARYRRYAIVRTDSK